MQRDLTEYMHGAEHVTCRRECHEMLPLIAKKEAFGHSNSKSTNKTDKVMDIHKDKQANKFTF